MTDEREILHPAPAALPRDIRTAQLKLLESIKEIEDRLGDLEDRVDDLEEE